ncbi:MAG: acyl-CoA dehydrogenase family protein [Burkholderiales bacterium]|nr:acyl-CoA dehydrogenase family protein [Burkholderiales bacterium]
MAFPIPRTLFEPEHEQFRESLGRFLEAEVLPNLGRYEAQGYIDREVWRKGGAAGFLCPTMPEEYGGAGADRRYSVVVFEETARRGAVSLLGWSLHSDIVAPYLLHYGAEEVKRAWLPRMATGEAIGAIAMTEPGAGSDLQAIATRAVRDGDHYRLSGSKTFITNGWHCDLVVVAAKTDPAQGARGTSLFVVDTASPGFTKGRPLEKVGLKAQDTAELFLDDVRVPAANRLGEEGRGFACLMQELPWERLQIAITAVALAEGVLEETIAYCRDRKAFGKPLLEFQNTRFALAEAKTELQAARVFVDRCIELVLAGTLDAATASMAKYWCSDLQCKVIDACVQLHGGNGYMREYAVARAWADARASRIYGGTNEIMKELISRSL